MDIILLTLPAKSCGRYAHFTREEIVSEKLRH